MKMLWARIDFTAFENLLVGHLTNGSSSVARGGGGAIAYPHWHVDQNVERENYYVFDTFETVLCTGLD